MFACDMFLTDFWLFLKGLEWKVAPFCPVVTLCLVDGELALQEALGTHIFSNLLLSN